MAREKTRAETINYEEADVIDALRDMTAGRGPDACIDAVGMEAHHASPALHAYAKGKQALKVETDRPHALREAVLSCRNGGTISAIGAYGGFIDKFPMGSFMNRSLTMRSGQAHVQRYMRRLLERIRSGEIDPNFIITHTIRLDDTPHGYDMMKNKQDDCVKVVLKPWPGPYVLAVAADARRLGPGKCPDRRVSALTEHRERQKLPGGELLLSADTKRTSWWHVGRQIAAQPRHASHHRFMLASREPVQYRRIEQLRDPPTCDAAGSVVILAAGGQNRGEAAALRPRRASVIFRSRWSSAAGLVPSSNSITSYRRSSSARHRRLPRRADGSVGRPCRLHGRIVRPLRDRPVPLHLAPSPRPAVKTRVHAPPSSLPCPPQPNTGSNW
jgi:hypothetical protein